MSSFQYSPLKSGKELLVEKYKGSMNQEQYDKHEREITNKVKSYWTDMDEMWKPFYKYLDKLDSSYDSYAEFGADKCGVSDMKKFCDLLQLDTNDLREQLKLYPLGRDTPSISYDDRFRGYHVASMDRKIVCTFASSSCLDGYFHYFGITGETEAVLNAYKVWCELGDGSQCWGGREYI